MTLHFNPPLEGRVRDEAARLGVAPEAFVQRLVEEQLAKSQATGRRKAGLALFAKWDAEDKTNDPAELELRRAGWEVFRKSMNENGLSDRPAYP